MVYHTLKDWNKAQIKEMFSELNIHGTNVEFGIDVMKLPGFERDQLLEKHYGDYGGSKAFRENNTLVIKDMESEVLLEIAA
jgi:hypothetical protein